MSYVATTGVGKTTMVAETLWRMARKNELPLAFQGGVVFYSFQGQDNITGAVAHIGIPPI
jgi:hypothetical protein